MKGFINFINPFEEFIILRIFFSVCRCIYPGRRLRTSYTPVNDRACLTWVFCRLYDSIAYV